MLLVGGIAGMDAEMVEGGSADVKEEKGERPG